MMEKIAFEVTEKNLETGMRGYPVGYCVTSTVDSEKGLFYDGYPVADLAKRQPESVIFLLFHGREGSGSEVEAFADEIKNRAILNENTIKHIHKLPRAGHPMKLLSAALMIAAMFDSTEDWREDCLGIIAKIPLIVAHVIAHHAGWEVQPSRPELGYMENFTQMIQVPDADQKALQEVFSVFNVLHYDHGGGNLSAFVGKAVASGWEGMYGSVAAAMCALAGPKHGKANQDCLQFVKEVLSEVGEDVAPEDMKKLVQSRLDNGLLIYGFGHAVLRVEDPRATVFYAMAEQNWTDNPLVKIARLLRSEAPKVLKNYPKVADPYPNVDAISGTVLSAAGFSYPEYFTVLFGLSRVVGISIQIFYERAIARGGKGVPIIRPRYLYKQRSGQ